MTQERWAWTTPFGVSADLTPGINHFIMWKCHLKTNRPTMLISRPPIIGTWKWNKIYSRKVRNTHGCSQNETTRAKCRVCVVPLHWLWLWHPTFVMRPPWQSERLKTIPIKYHRSPYNILSKFPSRPLMQVLNMNAELCKISNSSSQKSLCSL